MAKFDMGAAWEDSVALLKSHTTLTGTIAAVFLFLPSLAVAWFGPAPMEPPQGATLEQISTTFQQNVWQMLPYQLTVAVFAVVGTVAILRLWLSRTATSVGEALAFAARMIPTLIGLQILTGLIVGIGFVLLIIPGLYLIGRLALVSPLVADRGIGNPVEAIRTSWDMTRDNGWAIFFFLLLVTIVIVIIMLILMGVVSVVTGTAPGIGHIVSGFLESALGVAATMVTIAISAAAYRQLATRASTFE